jgi:hypothetical protein
MYAIKLAISFSKPRRGGGFPALTLGALRCARDNSTWSKEEDTSPLIPVEVYEFGG